MVYPQGPNYWPWLEQATFPIFSALSHILHIHCLGPASGTVTVRSSGALLYLVTLDSITVFLYIKRLQQTLVFSPFFSNCNGGLRSLQDVAGSRFPIDTFLLCLCFPFPIFTRLMLSSLSLSFSLFVDTW